MLHNREHNATSMMVTGSTDLVLVVEYGAVQTYYSWTAYLLRCAYIWRRENKSEKEAPNSNFQHSSIDLFLFLPMWLAKPSYEYLLSLLFHSHPDLTSITAPSANFMKIEKPSYPTMSVLWQRRIPSFITQEILLLLLLSITLTIDKPWRSQQMRNTNLQCKAFYQTSLSFHS